VTAWFSHRSRRTLLRGLFVLGVVAGVVWLPATAFAHPLGNFSVNVSAEISISAGEVQIEHVVDLAEIPTVQIMPEIDVDDDGTLSEEELSAWAWSTARELVPDLTLAVDDDPVTLSVVSSTARLRPGQGGLSILRLGSTFGGSIPARGELSFHDDTFADRVGWREITAVADGGVALVRSSVPDRSVTDGLRLYPRDLLTSPLDVRGAVVVFEAGTTTSGGERADVPVAPDGRAGVAAAPFVDLVTRHGPFMLLGLLLAFAIGALHAIGPGHGKTMMAAYIVGSGGRLRHAVAIGGTVAALHTVSVLGLGAVVLVASEVFPPERIYPWLTLGSGVIACCLGAGLLARRISARRAARLQGNDHPHEHHHPTASTERLLSWRGIAAISVAGGILPSPTALVALLGSIALDRVPYGLALVAAFSFGLAAALVVVGVVALRAGAIVSRRWSRRSTALVPVLSASTIAVTGVALAVRGLAQL
jgi:nickel/cobalt transporter (NicO) family protein